MILVCFALMVWGFIVCVISAANDRWGGVIFGFLTIAAGFFAGCWVILAAS